MWFWRKVSRARWGDDRCAEDPDHLAAAADQLSLRAGESGLSVYHVEDDAVADHVAALYASTTTFDRPNKLDYLLIPQECFVAIGHLPRHTPDTALHPFLSDRHHEVTGIDFSLSKDLARSILKSSQRRVVRRSPTELLTIVRGLVASDPTIRLYLRGDWLAHLE
jgi:hypothetical protein